MIRFFKKVNSKFKTEFKTELVSWIVMSILLLVLLVIKLDNYDYRFLSYSLLGIVLLALVTFGFSYISILILEIEYVNFLFKVFRGLIIIFFFSIVVWIFFDYIVTTIAPMFGLTVNNDDYGNILMIVRTVISAAVPVGIALYSIDLNRKQNEDNKTLSVMPFLKLHSGSKSGETLKIGNKPIPEHKHQNHLSYFYIESSSSNAIRDINIDIDEYDIFEDGKKIKNASFNTSRERIYSMIKNDFALITLRARYGNNILASIFFEKHKEENIAKAFIYDIHVTLTDILQNKYYQDFEVQINYVQNDEGKYTVSVSHSTLTDLTLVK